MSVYKEMEPSLIWVDLETGGLNNVVDGQCRAAVVPILEIAVVLTDDQFNIISEFNETIKIEDTSNFDPIALEMHTNSGLLDRCKASTQTLSDVQTKLMSWLQANNAQPYNNKTRSGVILAGSSVHFDRDFIRHQMKDFDAFLYYRQLDVSAVALLCRTVSPELEKYAVSHKTYKHTALADIYETINEARVYREALEWKAGFEISKIGRF